MNPPPPPEQRKAVQARRKYDPPGKLAEIEGNLRPWQTLISFALLVLGLLYGAWLALGFGITSESDRIARLEAEQRMWRDSLTAERRERRAFDSVSAIDRGELRSLITLTASQGHEILVVTCTGLPDDVSRRIASCRRVLFASVVPTAMRQSSITGAPLVQTSMAGPRDAQPAAPLPPEPRTPPTPPAMLPGKNWTAAMALVGGLSPTEE